MRKTYIDNIRWITVVIVVIYHVIYMFNGVIEAGVIGSLTGKVQYQDAFMYLVYPWFMVLLFVVSGMCSRYTLERKSDKEFIREKTRKLLVPSTIGLFVFQWILGYYNMAIGGAFENMGPIPKPVLYIIMSLSGTGVLWYIQMLWLFSVILIFVRKIEKDKLWKLCAKSNIIVLLLLTLLIFASAQVLNMPVVLVYRFGIYGLAFYIGYFVLSHDEVVDNLSKYWIYLVAAALILMLAFTITNWQKPYAEHIVLDTLLCNVFAWIAVLAIISFMNKFGNFENGFTKFMNRQSFGLYVFHYLPLAVCAYYIYKPLGNQPLLVYILTLISAFAGSFILYEVIRRIPFVRWCVLGMK